MEGHSNFVQSTARNFPRKLLPVRQNLLHSKSYRTSPFTGINPLRLQILFDHMLNNDLLYHLARFQSDPEGSIRAETVVLKDSFIHARVASAMGFMATAECFEIDDVAGKVVSAIVGATLDKEKLPETASTKDRGEDLLARLPGAYTQAGHVNSATGTTTALTGWAVSWQKGMFDMFSLKLMAYKDLPLSLTLLTCKQRSRVLSKGQQWYQISIGIPFLCLCRLLLRLEGKACKLGGNKAPASTLAEEVANRAGQGSSVFESAPPAMESKLASKTDGLGFGISLWGGVAFDLDTVKFLMGMFNDTIGFNEVLFPILSHIPIDLNENSSLDSGNTSSFNSTANTKNDKQDWQKVLCHFDRDCSGSINLNELAMPSVNSEVKASKIPCAYGVPPGITFDPFVRACVVIKQFSGAFQGLDMDNDGWVQINYDRFMRARWNQEGVNMYLWFVGNNNEFYNLRKLVSSAAEQDLQRGVVENI
ncbi:hypothetical protein EDB19DRAFT_1991423 [Suillus lakei]|nr:hypothetical protein EDB19DRAFT_1991423 [Suillus lakei]